MWMRLPAIVAVGYYRGVGSLFDSKVPFLKVELFPAFRSTLNVGCWALDVQLFSFPSRHHFFNSEPWTRNLWTFEPWTSEPVNGYLQWSSPLIENCTDFRTCSEFRTHFFVSFFISCGHDEALLYPYNAYITQNINKIQRSTIGFSLSGKETRDIGIGLAEIFIYR